MKSLYYKIYGEGNEEPVLIIAHGLFGSERNWRGVARYLCDRGRKVVAVDMRNHGKSFWSTGHSYEELGYDIKKVIQKFGDKADLMGHSMGGKAAMALALETSSHIRRLVVLDISPVTYFHNHSEYIDAMELLDLNLFTDRHQLDLQLAKSISDPSIRAFLLQSVDFTGKSKAKWRLNLNALNNNLTKIMGFPKYNTASTVPCLFIRGSLSKYVRDNHVEIINNYFPNSTLVTINGAGHWLHVEKKEELCNSALSFLTKD